MENILSKIKSEFAVDIQKKEASQAWLKIKKAGLLPLFSFLKKNGFSFFSSLSAVDIPSGEEAGRGKIELVYHLWNQEKKIVLNIKTEIDRNNPEIESASKVYEASQIHEREVHELFGVKFLGNADLSELFLENWPGPPPFLKDFNWRRYVREKFYNKEDENEKGYFF